MQLIFVDKILIKARLTRNLKVVGCLSLKKKI